MEMIGSSSGGFTLGVCSILYSKPKRREASVGCDPGGDIDDSPRKKYIHILAL
jgi:hypothetical protein